MKLLRSVSSPNRGTGAERRLVIRMLRRGVHPKAIFHDLYLQKRNGEFAQIDIVVATPQGLLAIEVKDYSGWLFGNEKQRYWTQVLNYGKEKYRFYNPIMQNAGHIKALRRELYTQECELLGRQHICWLCQQYFLCAEKDERVSVSPIYR